MLAVQIWAQDKPYIIQLIAPHFASLVEVFYGEFSDLKRRRLGSHKFPLPRLRPWFALYRSHRKSKKHLETLFLTIVGPEVVALVSGILAELQKPASATPKKKYSPEEMDQLKTFADNLKQGLRAASFEYLEDEFENKPVDPETADAVHKLLVDHPLDASFFIFVHVPCLFLYRMTPTLLYRKARLGDLDALKKILRLDQLMIHDCFIGQKVAAIRFNHNLSKYQNLVALATKSPVVDRRNILLSIAGLVYAISFLTDKPLKPQDISALFGAIADDTNNDELIKSIPQDSKSLGRELRSDRNPWRQMFNPDKKT